MVEYGRPGRVPGVHRWNDGSSGICPRPSRITRTTVPIMAATDAKPRKISRTIIATDILMHLVAQSYDRQGVLE
jgi:hypothetical protein